MKPKEFYVVIERDEDGIYVGEVPQLIACYSQGETIDGLMKIFVKSLCVCSTKTIEWCLFSISSDRSRCSKSRRRTLQPSGSSIISMCKYRSLTPKVNFDFNLRNRD